MKLSDIKKFKHLGNGVRTDWGPGFINVDVYYDADTLTAYQVFKDYNEKIKYASVTAKNKYEVVPWPKDPKDYKAVDPE